MSESKLVHLAEIVDRLMPGMWVELDRVAFSNFFDHQLDNSPGERQAGFAAAKAFADTHGAVFVPDEDGRKGRFGRAYPKSNSAA